MQFPTPLVPGKLIQRYKRFLADVMLEGGVTVTASCPNTGSMLGLTGPGSTVWLSENDSPTRKYRHAWELIENDLGAGPHLVGINSSRPNGLVTEAITDGVIPELAGYATLRREVRYGLASRIDILLTGGDPRPCYVEVKNVHLMRTAGRAEFPDSKTERGAKHLRELSQMVAEGNRAVMMFLVQRGDAESFDIARDIDPAYAEAFAEAHRVGVEMLCYRCRLSPTEIVVDQAVPILGLG
ncbi:DNA/RNA nuclease SfsA [Hyphomicrobium methylovorum]|uniref:DNA/RNA nuclease SfsA n=1 Tax=Hyphomicrobium methylovorum TaxID=84 RepID=UPI0015E654F8|nr:DNA/RNA nuclease SfsA [Hyphomicrobium methylovorum]MBA2127469.1 DNA/RNA nuclease SfsA [Hyphomicrobium methylovorum]